MLTPCHQCRFWTMFETSTSWGVCHRVGHLLCGNATRAQSLCRTGLQRHVTGENTTQQEIPHPGP